MAIIPDGLGTTLTFATSAYVIELTSITTPPIDGGDKIDLAHLGSTEWRMSALKTLKDVGQLTLEGHFDPDEYETAPVNVNQKVTITYPDGDKIDFYGGLRSITPGPTTEGDKTTISGIVEVTNNNAGVETGPAYTAAP